MAEKRSDASPYLSRYGVSRWVTAAQFICEVLCERRAKAERKKLPLQFWKDKAWGNEYSRQLVAVNALLKRLDPAKSGTGARAISAFLRSQRGRDVYSLGGAWVVPLVEAEHRKVVGERAASARRADEVTQEGPSPACLPSGPRPPLVARPSLLTRLKALE
jgi:hypothetical protein